MPVKFGLARHVERGIALREELPPQEQEGGAAGHPHFGVVKSSHNGGEGVGAKLQITIQLGDDVEGLTIQGRQAGVKGVHYSGAQLAAAVPPAPDEPDPGVGRGVGGDDLGGSVPAAVVDNEPEVGVHGLIDDGV